MFDTVFGTDPEMFIVDKSGNCVPPAALKEDFGLDFVDEKTLILADDWKIIEDGAATEINIRPSNNLDTIFERINAAKNAATEFVKDGFGLNTLIRPTVLFNLDKYWKGRGENFRDCVRFGCDPDLDIYSGEYSVEIDSSKINERYGGGHIHMQAPLNEPSLYEDIFYHAARLMDILVGNTGVAIKRPDNSWTCEEKSKLKYYGRPGRIRLQNYPDGNRGIEYRVPSNYWITDKRVGCALLTLMNCVFNLCLHPADAGELLNSACIERVPINILRFNMSHAKMDAGYILDMLAEKKYLDYEQYIDIVGLWL